jgi:hypothetical protein
MKNTFEELSKINVNGKLEKKGSQTYLSWAYAWAEVKKLFPNVQRKVYEREDGRNYFDDGRTAWVKVGVIINDIEHIDYLPIMNHGNKSIMVDNVTSFDVNKSIQRSTVKALALHGLALYVYAGEDMPEEGDGAQVVDVSKPKKTNASVKKGGVRIDLNVGDDNWEKVLKYVQGNKALGTASILKTLSTKYEITNVVKEVIEGEVAK